MIPLVGFYLQTAVGGIALPAEFWRRFAAIDNVVAIKMAPFNRYRTLDVDPRRRRGAAPRTASRSTPATTTTSCSTCCSPFEVQRGDEHGHRAHPGRPARPLERLDARRRRDARADPRGGGGRRRSTPTCWRWIPASPTATAPSSTSPTISPAASRAATRCCAARGCCRASGASIPNETLSPGQAEEIDRVCREHADLADDAFVAANLSRWLG